LGSSKKKYGVLGSYFKLPEDKTHDIYALAKDTADARDFDFKYAKDYDDFLVSLKMSDRVAAYKVWLNKMSKPVEVGRQLYDSPIPFVETWRLQEGMYREIVSAIPSDRPITIYSDGLGAASMICVELERTYESFEPNAIADRAKKLDIVTSKRSLQDSMIDSNTVKLFFNCVKYYDVSKIHGDVVVVDEDRLFF